MARVTGGSRAPAERRARRGPPALREAPGRLFLWVDLWAETLAGRAAPSGLPAVLDRRLCAIPARACLLAGASPRPLVRRMLASAGKHEPPPAPDASNVPSSPAAAPRARSDRAALVGRAAGRAHPAARRLRRLAPGAPHRLQRALADREAECRRIATCEGAALRGVHTDRHGGGTRRRVAQALRGRRGASAPSAPARAGHLGGRRHARGAAVLRAEQTPVRGSRGHPRAAFGGAGALRS